VLTQAALAAEVGEWGRVFVSMALLLFVFTTLVYNYYLGENALSFFSTRRWLLQLYRLLVIALVLWGSMQDLTTVFGFADVTMGLLAVVNLVALFLLFKIGLRLMDDYDQQIKAGVQSPVFDSRAFADLDIDHAAWPTVPTSVTQTAPPGVTARA
jgi:AGCS family alanine or glycine:cation symporter